MISSNDPPLPMPFSPYRDDEPVHRHQLKLPHWRQWGRTYFVTSRMADSIPGPLRDEWLRQRTGWLAPRNLSPDQGPEFLPEEERNAFHRQFTARFHELLDAGHGSCALADSEIAATLTGLFVSGHGVGYRLDCWVVMPNHFHVIVEPAENQPLGTIVKRWKGASARAINQKLGNSGSFWQAEAFDHIVRSERQLLHFRRYIAENPVKAGIHQGFVLGSGERVGLTPDSM